MLKQWKNSNLNLYYCVIPNSDKVLTNDGVVCTKDDFKTLTSEEYEVLKQLSPKYDYETTRLEEKLFLQGERKAKSEGDFIRTSQGNRNFLYVTDKGKELLDSKKEQPKITEKLEKEVKKAEVKSKVVNEKPKTKKSRKSKKTNKFLKMIHNFGNGFNLVSKIIMLIVCVGTGILSIYYTGTYMSHITNNVPIGFLISTTMYAYSLIGLNFSDILREQKKYVMSFIFLITSLCTIGFSMCTSLIENGEKYYVNKVEVSQNIEIDNTSKSLLLESINEQISNKQNSIDKLEKQNEGLSKTYSVIWDSEKKTNVVIEGKITEKAQENIDKNNNIISKYNEEIDELQKRKTELLSEGVTVEKNTEIIETFKDLLGRYLHIDGNILQLIMLLFASVFIDIISPLALMVVRNKSKE